MSMQNDGCQGCLMEALPVWGSLHCVQLEDPVTLKNCASEKNTFWDKGHQQASWEKQMRCPGVVFQGIHVTELSCWECHFCEARNFPNALLH